MRLGSLTTISTTPWPARIQRREVVNKMENTQTIKVHVDKSDVDLAIGKVERLNELLKEACSLAGELASMEITLSVNI